MRSRVILIAASLTTLLGGADTVLAQARGASTSIGVSAVVRPSCAVRAESTGPVTVELRCGDESLRRVRVTVNNHPVASVVSDTSLRTFVFPLLEGFVASAALPGLALSRAAMEPARVVIEF